MSPADVVRTRRTYLSKVDSGQRGDAGPVLPPLPEERLEPLPGPGVDHIVGGEPAALGSADAVAQAVKVDGRVRVAVDGELHAESLGAQDVFVAEVEAVGQRVDLQRGAGARA